MFFKGLVSPASRLWILPGFLGLHVCIAGIKRHRLRSQKTLPASARKPNHINERSLAMANRKQRRQARAHAARVTPQPRSIDWLVDPYEGPGLEPSEFEWPSAIRPPACTHWRQPVEIAQETVVYASAYCDRPRTHRWEWPQIGIYLSDASPPSTSSFGRQLT